MTSQLQLIIKEEAAEEILNAFDYYEEQQYGLGDYFLNTLKNRFTTLLLQPNACPVVYANYRQAVVPKFPFVIVYEIERDTIIVFSVFHTSRDPKGKIK